MRLGRSASSCVAFACGTLLLGASGIAPSVAPPAGTWAPQGIEKTSDTLDAVLAKLHSASDAADRPGAERIDRFAIDAFKTRIDASAHIRGDDYSIAAVLGTQTLRFGRAGGERWRATSAGTVHLIRADVQGDYLDRWPVAVLGFDAADCSLAGVAKLPRPAWVIADRPPLDIPRWLYVDVETGDIVREISREGGRVETYDFGDVRGTAGERRPYRWSVSGPGGTATVTLTGSSPASIPASDVAIPEQGPPEFSPPSTTQRLEASFSKYYSLIDVGVRVDGRERRFTLDSGTPELIFSDAFSRANGPIVLGHGTAATIDVAGQVARDAPFVDVDFNRDGLLGYDFFRGRIVHVDYAHGYVEVLPRTGFAPPSDALALPVDWSEGMPIATLGIGNATGSRFVLDLGSSRLVLSRSFVDRAGATAGITLSHERSTIRYLEGPYAIVSAHVDALQLGSITIDGAPADVELPDPNNIGITVDGIVGTEELSLFEWWFDADGTVSWFRPQK